MTKAKIKIKSYTQFLIGTCVFQNISSYEEINVDLILSRDFYLRFNSLEKYIIINEIHDANDFSILKNDIILSCHG